MNDRITIGPNICHGQPCIKGTRIMVYLILELIEAGLTPDEIIRDHYPSLTKKMSNRLYIIRINIHSPILEDIFEAFNKFLKRFDLSTLAGILVILERKGFRIKR